MFELFLPGRTGRSFFSTTPNRWDWALLPLVLALLAIAAWGAMQMGRPFVLGQPTAIALLPAQLPYYLARTILRMFAALACSLVFTCLFAVTATRWRAAEKVLVPLLDVLQSVPILGFQAIAIAPFIALFPGRLLGVECVPRTFDLRHRLGGPGEQHVDGVAQRLAQGRDAVLDGDGSGADDLAFDDAVALEPAQGRAERLLRHHRDRAAQDVEPARTLAQLVEHVERPLVEHVGEQLAVRCVDDQGVVVTLGGFGHDTWSR